MFGNLGADSPILLFIDLDRIWHALASSKLLSLGEQPIPLVVVPNFVGTRSPGRQMAESGPPHETEFQKDAQRRLIGEDREERIIMRKTLLSLAAATTLVVSVA